MLPAPPSGRPEPEGVPHVRTRALTSETGRLSQWDDITYRHAAAIGWDWRLLASVMYQESHRQFVTETPTGAIVTR
jgi:membrane-bound lytic murein transglycosylase MltF